MGLISAIRKNRRNRDARQDSRLLLGGSQADSVRIVGRAGASQTDMQYRGRLAEERLIGAQENAANLADGYERGYARSLAGNNQAIAAQRDSIAGIGQGAQTASGILSQAQGANQLTGSAESVLAQRAAQIGGAPSYQQLTDEAVAAQQANARNQTNFAQGQLAKQAMGVAAGQGEGGALAGQQAMASLVGAGGNMAVQSNLQQAQNEAAMRAQANMAARGETVDEAKAASDVRMRAAETERNNQMAVAGKQADLSYNSGLATNAAQGQLTGATQAQLNTGAAQQQAAAGQANQLATGVGSQAVAREGMYGEQYNDLLKAQVNAGSQREANQSRPAWAQALFPMGMLGPKS